jgi:cell division GTPase FtsZ
MATQLGTAVNFGFVGVNGITGLTTGYMLQNVDHTKQADVEEVRDPDGDVVSRVFHNANETATLECVVTGSSLSAALSNTALNAAGAIVSITACPNVPELVQTNWVVETSRLSGSNTTAKRVTLELRRHAGITAAAT